VTAIRVADYEPGRDGVAIALDAAASGFRDHQGRYRLGGQIQLVGDDIIVTNPTIIADAIGCGVGNAAVIKIIQVGTVTETLEAMTVCRKGGYAQLVSHRSGGDNGYVHRRSCGRQRMRGAEGRRSRARRAGRQVQPVARDRRIAPRSAVRAPRLLSSAYGHPTRRSPCSHDRQFVPSSTRYTSSSACLQTRTTGHRVSKPQAMMTHLLH